MQIGAARISPPRSARQTSRPVDESTANIVPSEAPKTSAPPVESSPLKLYVWFRKRGEKYSHFIAPLATASARRMGISREKRERRRLWAPRFSLNALDSKTYWRRLDPASRSADWV